MSIVGAFSQRTMPVDSACHFYPDGSIFLTCPHDSTGVTCPTPERLREFTQDGSRFLTCPHALTGPTCPTRDPLTSSLLSLLQTSFATATRTTSTPRPATGSSARAPSATGAPPGPTPLRPTAAMTSTSPRSTRASQTRRTTALSGTPPRSATNSRTCRGESEST